MRGSFASLPSLQCSSKHCHTRSLVTLDFFFVCLYKQETGYLVNPGHLDIYSGASGDNGPCLSPTAWCVDRCSSSVPFPLPWHTTAPAQLVLQSVTGIVTHRIKHKIKLWHTGSNTKSNWSPNTAALRRLHCSADVHRTRYEKVHDNASSCKIQERK